MGVGMELTTLGTGVAFPEADRGPTSHLIRCGTFNALVDIGSGSLQKLHRAGGSVLTLDALFVTHAHLDHIADLIPLLFALHVPGYSRTRPLDVFASIETHEIISAAQAAFGDWLRPSEQQVAMHVVERGSTLRCGPLSVRSGAVNHTESSISWRFTAPDGAVLAIPGDSGPCEELVESIRGADVAIVECSTPDEMPLPTHLSPRSLSEAAARAQVEHLLVVHRYPWVMGVDIVAEIASRFEGRVSIPDDMQRFVVLPRART